MTVPLEWGLAGARHMAGRADVLVVVDVFSFCTAVDVACSRGATIFPSGLHEAGELATRLGAELASPRRVVTAEQPYSLSPGTLASVPAGTRLVLASPNGSALTAEAAALFAHVFAACLRNASSVARAARELGHVAIVAAGERWRDGSLRPCVEDYLGAGAVAAALDQSLSVESELAATTFEHARPTLARVLRECEMGRDLIEAGFAADVELASALDASTCVPRFRDGAYTDSRATGAE